VNIKWMKCIVKYLHEHQMMKCIVKYIHEHQSDEMHCEIYTWTSKWWNALWNIYINIKGMKCIVKYLHEHQSDEMHCEIYIWTLNYEMHCEIYMDIKVVKIKLRPRFMWKVYMYILFTAKMIICSKIYMYNLIPTVTCSLIG
jgi:hypothetical protein